MPIPRGIDRPAPEAQFRLAVSTVELRDVVRPGHASVTDMLEQTADGALQPVDGTIWADDPVRAVTARLAEAMDPATVAAEPRPLSDRAQARVDLRLTRMLARADRVFELAGQVAITSAEDIVADRVDRFSITVPSLRPQRRKSLLLPPSRWTVWRPRSSRSCADAVRSATACGGPGKRPLQRDAQGCIGPFPWAFLRRLGMVQGQSCGSRDHGTAIRDPFGRTRSVLCVETGSGSGGDTRLHATHRAFSSGLAGSAIGTDKWRTCTPTGVMLRLALTGSS